jgi:uncharacterized RDD family membrane protein YckC
VGALWIDAALLGVAVLAIVRAAAGMGRYVPAELVYPVGMTVYAPVAVGLKGTTVGKRACGLWVERVDGGEIGLGRAVLRETLGKALAAAPLMLGFVVAATNRKRRGVHDFVAGTRVVVNRASFACRGMAILGIAGALFSCLAYVWTPLSMYLDARELWGSAPPEAGLPAASVPVEASRLGMKEQAELAAWLDVHGRSPTDYVAWKLESHDVGGCPEFR